MTNNFSQSGERHYSREDIADVAARKNVVDVAVPYARNTLLAHFPNIAQAPAAPEQPKPVVETRSAVNTEAFANVAINSTVQDQTRKLTEHEQALAEIRQNVAGKY